MEFWSQKLFAITYFASCMVISNDKCVLFTVTNGNKHKNRIASIISNLCLTDKRTQWLHAKKTNEQTKKVNSPTVYLSKHHAKKLLSCVDEALSSVISLSLSFKIMTITKLSQKIIDQTKILDIFLFFSFNGHFVGYEARKLLNKQEN